MSEQIYDIAVVGGGPAGLSAAITARARNKQTVVLSNKAQDNPLAKSKVVENYPGMPKASGMHILETMHEQAKALGAEFVYARAINILPMGDRSFVITTSDDSIMARSVVLALGTQAGGRPIDGELAYLGRGVSYCATCDGMLYRSSTVCVIGENADAPEEANFLASIGASVHYLSRKETSGLSEQYIQEGKLLCHLGRVDAITGDDMAVGGVSYTEKDEAGEEHSCFIECQGVFILRPTVAATSLLTTLKTEDGYIKVDGQMQTSEAGVFAAGDCTGKPLQVAKAVGEGQVAVFSAVDYLDR